MVQCPYLFFFSIWKNKGNAHLKPDKADHLIMVNNNPNNFLKG